jgi:aerobic-type carbon monoxide dehydrogenase small subunit (CoxS/CutS family)
VRLTVNGRQIDVDAHPLERLLDVLRERLGLSGTKEGCGEGECGACTVLLDGRPVNACLVPVLHAEGHEVITIEGLREHAALQEAFVTEGGTQCGMCTPGFVMAATALAPGASLAEVREALAGNICRCTGYEGIYRALARALDQPGRGGREG